MNLGSPSDHLAQYMKHVEDQTGRIVEIRPYDDATIDDSPRASLELGPEISNIDIRFCPIRRYEDPTTEKLIAHELTHALMVYSEGYQIPCAPKNVSEYDVQTVAEIVDLVDDVIVDVRIHRLGFKLLTFDLLAHFNKMLAVLEIASSRAQIDSYEDDSTRAEIKFVSNYIYAWALPRYIKLPDEARNIYARFVRRFPQILKEEFAKVRQIKKLITANDIFTLEGRTRVVVEATGLWPINESVYLSRIAAA
jgi:hypothetical protein